MWRIVNTIERKCIKLLKAGSYIRPFLLQVIYTYIYGPREIQTHYMIYRMMIYGALGWIMEVLWTGTGSLINGDPRLAGGTYLWMFPIYGLAVFLEPIHDYIKNNHWVLRGFIYTVLIFILYYITGWLLREIIAVCPWNYNVPLAINGLVRLDYAPAWFVLGLVFERIHIFLDQRVFV